MPRRSSKSVGGFTLVEVMMAATILVMAFFGMISALTAGNEMMATARRQTIASKMIDHEIETLRLQSWSTISSLSSTHSSNTGFVWSSGTTYRVRDVVVYSGTWYRCTANHSGQTPPNASYWSTSSAPYTIGMSSTGVADGATYTLTRSIADVTGPVTIREITFTVTWTVTPSGGVASRTYTRKKSANFSQYGLNLTYQRT